MAIFYLTKNSKVNEWIEINLPFIVVEVEKGIPGSKPATPKGLSCLSGACWRSNTMVPPFDKC